MIPRYQRVLFWTLSAAILLMALFMLRGCTQVREKFTRQSDQTPLDAPVATATEAVHLAIADDSTGLISMVDRDLALPEEQTSRARALLGRLLGEYTYKGSKHPLDSGPAVDAVFLLNLPLPPAVASGRMRDAAPLDAEGGQRSPNPGAGKLAVINLRSSFVDHHPSGIEVESLTVQSILGTLYANFPTIEQVRFLVDGQPRDTLSGHADLRRTYPVLDMSAAAAQAVKGTDR
jgi:sporulation and spore germination protein